MLSDKKSLSFNVMYSVIKIIFQFHTIWSKQAKALIPLYGQ